VFFKESHLPIIDLRSAAEFQKSHVKHATHINFTQLTDRIHELPKRPHALRLVGNSDELVKASEYLTDKGYTIDACLEWSDETEQKLHDLSQLTSGEQSRRLWSPAKIIESFVHHNRDQAQGRKALDIACGSGRDAVFLALHGWQVSAVDYLPGAIDKLNNLAQTHRTQVTSYLLDLESDGSALQQIEGQFDLIVVVRYLHRPLLPLIKAKIRPGGYIVYQTFMRGCEQFGRPKNPRFLLAPGELAESFSGFTIIQDDVEILPDGRPTNVFIAQNKVAT